MIGLTISSLLIVALYLIAVSIKQKKIPKSISSTYYALKHKLWFGAGLSLTALLMFPPAWELSTNIAMKILSISSSIGLIGVGLVPDSTEEKNSKIHTGSGTLSLLSAQIYVAMTTMWYILIPIWGAFATYALFAISKQQTGSLKEDFNSTNAMFWCEIAGLSAPYIALIALL